MQIPRKHHGGFSLVELMAAVTIAMITGLVVVQALAAYQARKQTTTGHNEAEINASIGMYALEQDVRNAGTGLMSPAGLLCAAGINIQYNGAVYSDGGPFRAVQIVDGGAGPDTIRVMRSEANQSIAPINVLTTMATPADVVTIAGASDLADRQLVVVGRQDGSKICTLMQLTQAPALVGTSWQLTHASATSLYNPANPAAAFTNPVAYAAQDAVVGLGSTAIWSIGVLCNDGGTPTSTNNCDLVRYDQFAGAPPVLGVSESLAPQVIDLQAQYGIAAAGSQNVTQWVDATGAQWTAPVLADQNRIKALRIAIVTRGSREATIVSPPTLVLWDGGFATQRVRALTADEQHYRYQVLTMIVPLINIIWATL